jgi:hypothetical protein
MDLRKLPLSLLVSVACVSMFLMFSVISIIPPVTYQTAEFTQEENTYAAQPSESPDPVDELDEEYDSEIPAE